MPISQALRGVPKEAFQKAINAYAEDLYGRAHDLLRELRGASADDLERIKEELEQVQVDATELLQLNVLGHLLPSKMKLVAGIYLPREQALQRYLHQQSKQNNGSTNHSTN